ncbi:hypothetical protein LGQ02_19400 [Bacillus shivajii]|uniref:hypothetical protein n=1 Tax=Bacillus shivajii TaxID=1983719 RepID=UPI001CFA3E85|nr:hypothetical protein [Bacillus shivajii]UCZ52921.1 hypothetical protein LGQ02_19400 [Bacillus shivajii]
MFERKPVIREEYFILTGDFALAVILDQMVHWSGYAAELDRWIEEQKKKGRTPNLTPMNGWFCKTAEELVEETMLNVSPNTMNDYLNRLIELGWIEQRPNPRYNKNPKELYRVNFAKLHADLEQLGFEA